ncbi:nicotinate-nucleotide adenylyltransferase [Vulcaniibacterium tengchongense]|uniref:Probable nicotinate-nucleotide adenylyltransferase n=1 Tax=Vulcaniibacterium tengchongense TaxID=1273429 RepID=A0A3N4VT42_9GAMM|nr:nicotinate-nucleotide adenylyltransferase [Vulcaniibacterium tengchongense]RPE76980.1 nicotinate-nucleotide adenylyltransferase [Vulcaniibacterium tengchongense]
MATLRVCYGGTFDPVHLGHLAVARQVRDALAAPVALLPAADPPHKDATHADAEARARMLELAVAGERGLSVDRRELRRPGPSYTVDTLRSMRAEFGARAPLVWIVGGDSLLQLDRWHRWRELFAHAHILAVARPGSPLDAATVAARAPQVAAEAAPRRRDPARLGDDPAGGFAVLELAGLRPESSTELRRRIAAGEPWQDWVPPAVAEYIRRHGLYAHRGAASAPV